MDLWVHLCEYTGQTVNGVMGTFRGQMTEASRHHHQLGHNSDPLLHRSAFPPIWPSLQHKSTPELCSTFQDLLIDCICAALLQKSIDCRWTTALNNYNIQILFLLRSTQWRILYTMLDTMAGQDEVCTKLMVLKVLNQPNPQVNNFSPSKKAWIRPQDGIKMIWMKSILSITALLRTTVTGESGTMPRNSS